MGYILHVTGLRLSAQMQSDVFMRVWGLNRVLQALCDWWRSDADVCFVVTPYVSYGTL